MTGKVPNTIGPEDEKKNDLAMVTLLFAMLLPLLLSVTYTVWTMPKVEAGTYLRESSSAPQNDLIFFIPT